MRTTPCRTRIAPTLVAVGLMLGLSVRSAAQVELTNESDKILLLTPGVSELIGTVGLTTFDPRRPEVIEYNLGIELTSSFDAAPGNRTGCDASWLP